MSLHSSSQQRVAPPLNRSPSWSEDRWVLIGLAALCCSSLLFLFVVRVPPLQDLPNHLLKVEILWRYLAGDPEVRAIYALNLKPLSNYTCYVVLFVLGPLVGLFVATKLIIAAYLIGFPLASYAFLRRTNPENVVLALATPALAFNLFLAKGNLNFCLALALYLAALAVFCHPADRGGARTTWLFAALATALYFTHGIVFLTLVAVVVCLVVLDPVRPFPQRALGLVPGLACNLLMMIDQATTSAGARALRPLFERPGWYLIGEARTWLLEPHGWDIDSYFGLALVAVLGACALFTLVRPGIESRSAASVRAWLAQNRWAIVTAMLALFWLAAPVRLADWGHLRARFIPLVALTGLAALRVPRARLVRIGIAAVFVLAAIAIQLRNAIEYVRGDMRVAEYVQGLSVIEPQSSLLPIDTDESEEDVRFNLHSWAYYHIEKGGWGPFLHAYPSYMPVVFRTPPWGPEDDFRSARLEAATVERAADCYDYVLVWEKEGNDGADLLEPRFAQVYSSTHLHIWRNRRGLRKSPPAASEACLRRPLDSR